MDQRAESRAGNPRAESGLKPPSRLAGVLRSGRFAVTSELNPPDSADPQAVYDRALVLASVCDAINATDASGANVHMSSVGVCALLTRAGYEPVMQVSCRDRNRIAIQGDLLGAAAMGVRNVLCITGDGVQTGDQPQAKPVFDLDSIGLLEMAVELRDEGRFMSGRKLEAVPDLFLGAAANPFAPPYDFRPLRLAKKIAAGAQFIQTQYCFDVSRLRSYMSAVRQLGLHHKAYILVGVGPLRSAQAAAWMRENVPGVVIPDHVIDRLRRAPRGRQAAEGSRLCVEIIQQVREIEGVHGVHVMAYRQEETVAEIIEKADLLPTRRMTEWRQSET
jgi:methylenetetrahydrofolate reductase (NADPH)